MVLTQPKISSTRLRLRLLIAGRLMGIVAALLAVKVHRRIARIIVVRRGLVRLLIFALETFLPSPSFDQRAVDREVLVREQAPLARLRQYRRKERLGHL